MFFLVILITILSLQTVPIKAGDTLGQICTDYKCFAGLTNANQLDAVSGQFFDVGNKTFAFIFPKLE